VWRGDGRTAPYVHGSGSDGSRKSSGLPEPTVRKSGRRLVAHFRTDLNCRVHSLGGSGTVGTGRSLYIPSWVNWKPKISRGTRTDRKTKWTGLIFGYTDRRSAFNDKDCAPSTVSVSIFARSVL
jgi:hypothetical protein